jgi:hypothetical protein
MTTVANGSSSEITNDVLKKYNKVRQAFGVRHVGKVANMALVQKFLDEHQATYTEIKRKHKPTTSIVPTSRYKPNNVTNATTFMTADAEPKLLPPIKEKGGGAAKQKR